ncbi:hypothetical protein N9064_00505 [bacterium]|nr:hypothetical protein [bacterium]
MNSKLFNKNLVKLIDFGVDFKEWSDCLDAPLFIWDDKENDVLLSENNDDVHLKLKTEPNLLPFKQLRLKINPNKSDTLSEVKEMRVWLNHTEDMFYYVVEFHRKGFDKVLHFRNYFALETGDLFTTLQAEENSIDLRNANEKMKESIAYLHTSICWFIREASSPTNFVAKVKPNRPFKSATWRESRAHYVIIDRKHPANKKGLSVGNKIEDKRNREIQAHSRRAHARVLRHEKWGKNIGKVIHVAATWVGPREWKSNNSIYFLKV